MQNTRVTDSKIYCRSEHPPVIHQGDLNHVHRQTPFLSAHGLHAIAHLSSLRCPVSRRSQSEEVPLHRPIPFAGISLLFDPCQIQSPVPENLLVSGGSINQPDLRPDDHAQRILSEQRLSRETATREISQRRNRSYHCSDAQQFQSAGSGHYRVLSITLASGTLFQMDQTTSSYQKFLWNLGERGKDF